MAACFLKMDEEVSSAGGDVSSVGSTALVAMVGKDELVVASCGDSRAVLCRAGIAVPLSRDHKPDRPDETERVEAAGGGIINWYGCRATVNERSELDEFIVIATDGLWDVVSKEFAFEIVRRRLTGQLRTTFPEECSGSCAAEAATMLAELALARGSKTISVL